MNYVHLTPQHEVYYFCRELSEIHLHNFIVVNAKIRFSKHLEHCLKILGENSMPPQHQPLILALK